MLTGELSLRGNVSVDPLGRELTGELLGRELSGCPSLGGEFVGQLISEEELSKEPSRVGVIVWLCIKFLDHNFFGLVFVSMRNVIRSKKITLETVFDLSFTLA